MYNYRLSSSFSTLLLCFDPDLIAGSAQLERPYSTKAIDGLR